MCEFRLGDYCFNPEHLNKGELARHFTKMPCCSGTYSGNPKNKVLDISKY